MAIGSQSAEAIKLAVAAATPQDEELIAEVRGRDLMTGLPREVQLGSEEVSDAIAAPLADILASVHAALEETPPELAADITKEGILLAGGGALLRGLEQRLEIETGMPVRVADAPLECVALGAGQSLEELDRMGRGRR
jgi:rod shape-determining protein MreB